MFATCPKAMEDLLAAELRALGAESAQEKTAGVAFRGPLELAYRACLWSRTASRILLLLSAFKAQSAAELYEGAAAVAWEDHLGPDQTLAVDGARESGLSHSKYAAQVVKDAVVDRLRRLFGRRPSVDTRHPDLRLNLHLRGDEAALGIDFSGESLHRRGYRLQGGPASLKENVAAALLLRAGWPELASQGSALVDPMCGSGTLPIEAALMAGDAAPGLLRSAFGFLGWKGHHPDLWEGLLQEARGRREEGLKRVPPVWGFDRDPAAVRAARANLARAGLTGVVKVERRELSQARPPAATGGIVVVNPPYGERLGEVEELHSLYRELGRVLLERFTGWRAAVLTAHVELAKSVGLHAVRIHTLYNGALKCRLAHFEVAAERRFRTPLSPQRALSPRGTVSPQVAWLPNVTVGPGEGQTLPAEARTSPAAEMLANRLRRNLRLLGRWARREGISCYRLYDADMPDYAVAIDFYEGRWAQVQEYAPPAHIDPRKALLRLKDVLEVLPGLLGIRPHDIFLKVRKRQKGAERYGKLASRAELQEVHEGGYVFLVNPSDYLDTGLFLDQRLIRALIGRLAAGRSFLNLFCYTAAATVYAAGGGAARTTSVDASRTYLDWAARNLESNGLEGGRNELAREDCLAWLRRDKRRYGIIFLDPPTYSNSKSRNGDLDLQRDHLELLSLAIRRLERGGVLIFSHHYRRFRLDEQALRDGSPVPVRLEDISRQTLPLDFQRQPRSHQCWQITLE